MQHIFSATNMAQKLLPGWFNQFRVFWGSGNLNFDIPILHHLHLHRRHFTSLILVLNLTISSFSSIKMSSTIPSIDATTPLLQSVSEVLDRHGEQLPKSEPEHAVQKWHNPIINTWRVLATSFSFIVVGANDAIYGVRHD